LESGTVEVTVRSGEEMQDLGRRLAARLRAGDLLIMSGGLGAGKTTLTRGIGAGLGVRGAVTSPTFVIARVHPTEVGGPALVHVDAYRLGGGTGVGRSDVISEIDDLDLDASLDESVTVIEWGAGRGEELAEERLTVVIDRAEGDDEREDDVRVVRLSGVGERWADGALDGL
jgi:tRNA threonylcarbamoyladenosine biosynthesis protein TsaE